MYSQFFYRSLIRLSVECQFPTRLRKEFLNFLYFNEGYVQVKIDRPEVYVTPDKKGVFITIRIDEGEKFDVLSVEGTIIIYFAYLVIFMLNSDRCITSVAVLMRMLLISLIQLFQLEFSRSYSLSPYA